MEEKEIQRNEWVFGVVGNVAKSHKDENGNVYYGTKAFKPGTKVYILPEPCEEKIVWTVVIGLNRFGRYVVESVPLNLIIDIKTQRIYNPKVIDFIRYLKVVEGFQWCERTVDDKKRAKLYAKLCKLEQESQ